MLAFASEMEGLVHCESTEVMWGYWSGLIAPIPAWPAQSSSRLLHSTSASSTLRSGRDSGGKGHLGGFFHGLGLAVVAGGAGGAGRVAAAGAHVLGDGGGTAIGAGCLLLPATA